MLFSVGQPSLRLNVDADGVLARVSTLDAASQRYVPAAFQIMVLHLCHHFLLAGYPGERHMYDSMPKKRCRPPMTIDVSATARNCRSCAKDRINGKQRRHLKLFEPKGPVDFVGMYIYGPPPKTKQINKFVAVTTDRFTKLATAILTTCTKATTFACICPEHWVSNYGVPSKILTNEGP